MLHCQSKTEKKTTLSKRVSHKRDKPTNKQTKLYYGRRQHTKKSVLFTCIHKRWRENNDKNEYEFINMKHHHNHQHNESVAAKQYQCINPNEHHSVRHNE